MTFGPQYEYKETDHNVGLYLQDPENEVRRLVDQIIAQSTDEGAPEADGGGP